MDIALTLPCAEEIPEVWGRIVQARFVIADGVWVLLMRDTGAFVGGSATRVASWNAITRTFHDVEEHLSVVSAHAVFHVRAGIG